MHVIFVLYKVVIATHNFWGLCPPHPLLYVYYVFYYIAIFKNPLNVNMLSILDFDNSKNQTGFRFWDAAANKQLMCCTNHTSCFNNTYIFLLATFKSPSNVL